MITTAQIIKAIPGLPGYGATRDGKIFTYWKRKIGGERGEFYISEFPKQMKVFVTTFGHERLHLGQGELRAPRLVHTLVLKTFVGPCPEGMEGCHKNGVPSYNHVDNLRWDTHASNMQDMVKHGNHDPHRGEYQKHSKLTEKLVKEIRETSGEISQQKWADKIGCSRALIGKVRQKLNWVHVT